MPSTFNGIGTKYVGASHRSEDNSFVTTTWFCILVPLLPLKSERVIYRGKTREHHFTSSRESAFYTVLQRVKLDTKQILKYYGIWAFLLLFPIITLSLFAPAGTGNYSNFETIVGLSVILWIAWIFLLVGNLVFKPK